jgi:hypothetical protein
MPRDNNQQLREATMTKISITVALLTLLSSASVAMAQMQELQQSEWPTKMIYLDVPDNAADCEAAGGKLTLGRGNPSCFISPEDCILKGNNWKVVRRSMHTIASANTIACHRMP